MGLQWSALLCGQMNWPTISNRALKGIWKPITRETCQVSALKALYGPDVAISEDEFYDFDASVEDQEAAHRPGQGIKGC